MRPKSYDAEAGRSGPPTSGRTNLGMVAELGAEGQTSRARIWLSASDHPPSAAGSAPSAGKAASAANLMGRKVLKTNDLRGTWPLPASRRLRGAEWVRIPPAPFPEKQNGGEGGIRSALRALRDRCRLAAASAAPSGSESHRRPSLKNKMAERVGFEPTDRLHGQRFSRPPRSTTPAPLRDCMAEREGFEPSVESPLHTISSRAPSTTRSPLRRPAGAIAALRPPIAQRERRSSKNLLSSPPHSSSSTPEVTARR